MDWKQQQIQLFKEDKQFNQKLLDHHYLRLDGNIVVSSYGSSFPSKMITKYLDWFDNTYLLCKSHEEIEEAKKIAPTFSHYKIENVTHYSVMFGCLDLRLRDIREISEEMK